MTTNPSPEDYRAGKLRRVRALIVGGGATGQVYGYHLSQAGVEVSYLLKPKYAAEAEEGFDLHRFGFVGRRPVRHFEGFDVVTRTDEVHHLQYDQIWLCVSSPAIRASFVDELNERLPEALWVSLQPGVEDREYLLQKIPAERLVSGMIGIIAYQAPLGDEEIWPPGIAYWTPPLSPTLFSGPENGAVAVANLLQTGGLKAALRADVASLSKYAGGALIPFVIAVEARSWSLTKLRRDSEMLGLLCAAIEEFFAAVQAETQKGPGGLKALIRVWAWKMALFTAPIVAPFPLEEYLEFHFSKVREQSEQMIDSFIDLCDAHSTDHDALATLRDEWLSKRSEIEQAAPPEKQLVVTSGAGDEEVAAESLEEITDEGGAGETAEVSVDVGVLPVGGLDEETEYPGDLAIKPVRGEEEQEEEEEKEEKEGEGEEAEAEAEAEAAKEKKIDLGARLRELRAKRVAERDSLEIEEEE